MVPSFPPPRSWLGLAPDAHFTLDTAGDLAPGSPRVLEAAGAAGDATDDVPDAQDLVLSAIAVEDSPPPAQATPLDSESSNEERHEVEIASVIKDADDVDVALDEATARLAELADRCSKIEYDEPSATANDKVAQVLAEAAQDGFNLRGSLGQQFAASEGKCAAYKALKGKPGSRQLQSDFRKQWAQCKLEEYQKEKVKLTSWRRVDKTKGKYKSLAKIAVDEGGGKQGLSAATRLAIKCCRMGGDWLRWNGQTDRFDYLHLEASYEESMTQAWELYQRWKSTGQPAPSVPASQERPASLGESAAARPTQTTEPPSENAKAKAKAKTTPRGADNPKKQKTSFDDAIAKSQKTRQHMLNAMSQSEVFLGSVRSQASWSWAVTGDEVMLEPLKQSLAELQALAQKKEIQALLAHGIERPKDDKDRPMLEKQLVDFSSKLDPILDIFHSELRRLKRMHAAR